MQQERHPRDTRIRFISDTHTYVIDEKQEFESVTTVIKSFFDPFNADRIIEQMQVSKHYVYSPYFAMNKEKILSVWEEKKQIGKDLHQYIDDFYKRNAAPPLLLEYKTLFHRFHHQEIENHLRPVRTEWSIFDEDHQIAGTVDALFQRIHTGEYILVDWKCISGLKFTNSFRSGKGCLSHLPDCNMIHYSLQLNLYKYILEKYYQKRIHKMYIIVFNKQKYHKYEIPFMEEEIKRILATRNI